MGKESSTRETLRKELLKKNPTRNSRTSRKGYYDGPNSAASSKLSKKAEGLHEKLITKMAFGRTLYDLSYLISVNVK